MFHKFWSGSALISMLQSGLIASKTSAGREGLGAPCALLPFIPRPGGPYFAPGQSD